MDEPKEGYYGGQVCGPVFREVAERCASYLNIPSEENLPQPNGMQVAAMGHAQNNLQTP
jgi:hypothetical protein